MRVAVVEKMMEGVDSFSLGGDGGGVGVVVRGKEVDEEAVGKGSEIKADFPEAGERAGLAGLMGGGSTFSSSKT